MKRYFKRAAALLLTLLLLFSLVGCAESVVAPSSQEETASPNAPAAEETEEPAPAEETEEPAPEEDAEEPAPEEDAEEPAPEEDAEEPAPAEEPEEPASEEDAEVPAPEEDAEEPAPEEDAEEPAPGEDAEEPASGEDGEEPDLEEDVPAAALDGKSDSPEVKEGSRPPIRVSTAEELMNAIADNALIKLASGTYDLTEWASALEDPEEWMADHPAVRLEDVYDGLGVVICDVEGLTLRGDGDVEILVQPRYADVLRFERCSDVTLSGLVMGHAPDAGYCSGDVLEFDVCSGIRLQDLELYGCGTYGVNGYECQELRMDGCTIRDCSFGAMCLDGCSGVGLSDCALINCEGFDLLAAHHCAMTFENCLFRGNRGDQELISREGKNAVRFLGCSFGEWESDSAARLIGQVPGLIFDAECAFTRAVPTPVIAESLDQLFTAIASETVIFLEPGEYDLSAWAEKAWGRDNGRNWNRRSDHVLLNEESDGIGIQIDGVNNLTICGASPDDTVLTADTEDGNVLHFYDCENLTLAGMSLVNLCEQDPDSCGNVIALSHAVDTTFFDLELSGASGAALDAWDSKGLVMYDSVLRDCCNYALDMMSCAGSFFFRDSVFTGSREYGMSIFASDDAHVTFQRCTFGSREADSLSGLSNVDTMACVWGNDSVGAMADLQDRLKLVRFDAEALADTQWEGIRLLYPGNGVDYLLPTEEDGIPIFFRLSLRGDGTGELEWMEDGTVPFRWDAESSAFQCEISLENDLYDGLQEGTLWLYADPESDGEELWLELGLEGEYYIWFALSE